LRTRRRLRQFGLRSIGVLPAGLLHPAPSPPTRGPLPSRSVCALHWVQSFASSAAIRDRAL
jgi:hypothetical protein